MRFKGIEIIQACFRDVSLLRTCAVSSHIRCRYGDEIQLINLKTCVTRETTFVTSCFLDATIRKTRLFKYIENFSSKNWKFSDKKTDIFHISAQNIYCGYLLEPLRRNISNEYPKSMFSSRNKKNNVYPCKPQFYYVKLEGLGVKNI